MTKRTLRADARRNRARLLQVAAEAFATGGLSVPLDEIARRAGLGPGTLYRHFPTKQALLEAVVNDRLQTLVDAARALRHADDAGADLLALISGLLLALHTTPTHHAANPQRALAVLRDGLQALR
jgi:AcrR family transcriptional regulator